MFRCRLLNVLVGCGVGFGTLLLGNSDWMLPIATAHLGRDLLQEAGARLVYRELADLSHTYPRDENPKILDWLLA